jgi:chromate resistance exported protein
MAWLIRRSIDTDAVFVFVNLGEVATEAQRLDGMGFHASASRYLARDGNGRTPFEALVEQHCQNDAALMRMRIIVRDADVRCHTRILDMGPPSTRGSNVHGSNNASRSCQVDDRRVPSLSERILAADRREHGCVRVGNDVRFRGDGPAQQRADHPCHHRPSHNGRLFPRSQKVARSVEQPI